MPTGYRGEGKHYNKALGRWEKVQKEKTFDYEEIGMDSGAFLVSFYRFYPDYFADLCRSETARYTLELPQRMMLRLDARYGEVYVTGCRGLTKTYIKLLSKMIRGILYPGITMRYNAPSQKQAAALATQAFKQIGTDYPSIAACWMVRNDRGDMFRITTAYGSEFTMYAPRGDNCNEIIGEEIAAEGGKEAFDMEKYESDILPTCRIIRTVNQKEDRTYIQLQHSYISNASSRQNRAFTVHRHNALKAMRTGEKYAGFVIDYSYITAVCSHLRNLKYIRDMKNTLTPSDWLREMCARYTGNGENPLLSDETIARSKRLLCMEERHAGDRNAIYIAAHDVSYVDGRNNAECADVVLKLTEYDDMDKRDKYRKQAVYVDSYPPPKTAYLQAQKLKKMYFKYCLNGGNASYLVVDAQNYGTEIVEELMKPSNDGTPNLCCYNHMRFSEIEQENALPVIYPMKAATRGATDADGEMIAYAQSEFEHGFVELLTANAIDGIEAYKDKHGIKSDLGDAEIMRPYKKTEELCQQISNLKAEVSGLTLKETRKSKAIQRDMWSALKYALRMAQILEGLLKKERYVKSSSWSEIFESGFTDTVQKNPYAGRRALLSLRKRGLK